MSHTTPSEAEVADTLSHLKLSTTMPQKHASKPKSKPVADSWDEEDLSSGSDTETEQASPQPTKAEPLTRTDSKSEPPSPISTSNSRSEPPNPPPPTPASPTPLEFPENVPYSVGSGVSPVAGGNRASSRAGSGPASPARRPDKTTAVANRLIAAGLGQRAPKRTEEEREYDKAMREKERKRRDEERAREKREAEAAEERKRSVWED